MFFSKLYHLVLFFPRSIGLTVLENRYNVYLFIILCQRIPLYPKYYFKVKMMKILRRGANSLPRNRIWLKLNIIKADLYMLVTNKFEQDKINS